MKIHSSRNLLFALFTLSGFSGLIYESIWTHYLKLFLGHAAYAQTLVLAIFMGGMALGSWICGARSARWKNLLLGYALVEGLIGVAALFFHTVFDGYVQYAYTTLLPALGDPALVTLLKWLSAAALILPQSVLLGMTFPLMSGALIRRFPDTPGATVATLYFTNSIGAAVGVLVSGFVLIEAAGLPGTIRVAGILNLLLAAFVWWLAGAKTSEPQFAVPTSTQANFAERRWFMFFVAIAAFTGAASFIYEIAWIRMLSLVLGSSTHAFELMLSAFILGLALGGLWIRRRIDRIADTVRFLALVQILMGALAAATLFMYDASFDVMRWLVNTLPRNDTGYLGFNFASDAIAMAIMVPATFLAGTTLPLLTYTLMKQGHGEKSIGSVYAGNTLGAIGGVFFATHLGMPLLGLKGLLLVGAGLDVALGIVLLWRFATNSVMPTRTAWTAAGIGALALTTVFGPLDLLRMSSGVYRTGLLNPADYKLLFHRDGKTASIDLLESKNTPTERHVSILTNGKPDAMINMAVNGPSAPDESTMILAGALPLAFNPDAKSAAVIGMGSGMSTNTLLTADQLQDVDTIEIERAVIEAANGFRPRVELAYSSPHSHFHIEDAKTYFSTHNKRYDIILSEPSNPWVSGTAALFTGEFYTLIKRHLAPHGVLIQWLQTYELDEELVASVLKAVTDHFDHYVIYAPNDVDLLIVARADGPLTAPSPRVFDWPTLRAELGNIGINNLQDLELRRIGDRQALAPLFASFAIAANSDYYPVLDLRATRTRYLKVNAANLIAFRNASVPALEMLNASGSTIAIGGATPYAVYQRTRFARIALQLRDYLVYDRGDALQDLDANLANDARVVKSALIDCRASPNTPDWLRSVATVTNMMMPQLAPEDMVAVLRRINNAPCSAMFDPLQLRWFALLTAVAQRNGAAMAQVADELLPQALNMVGPALTEYVLLCGLLGHVIQNDLAAAQGLWARYAPLLYTTRRPALTARLLAAHAYRGAPIPLL